MPARAQLSQYRAASQEPPSLSVTKSDPRYQEVGENMATPSQVEAAPLVLTAQLDTLESLLSSLADARSALDPLFSAFAAGPSSSASSLIAGDGHGPPALPPVGALGGAQKQKQWREAVVGAVEAVGKLKTSVQGSQSVLQATQESAKQDPNHIVVSPPGPRLPAPKSTSRSRRRIRAPLPARDPSPRTEDELDATLRSYEGLEVEKVAERRRGGKDFQVVVKVPGVMRVLLDLRWRTSSEDMTEDDGRVVVIERGNCFALHEGEPDAYHVSAYGVFRSISRCLHQTLSLTLADLSPGCSNVNLVLSFLRSYTGMFDGRDDRTLRFGVGLMPPTRRIWRRDAGMEGGEEGWDPVGDDELV